MRKIYQAGEYMTLHDNGNIERHGNYSCGPSGQWKVTGAVLMNKFGHVVQRYSLDNILTDPGSIPWKHANGKQKARITDLDHGTHRVWGSPAHAIF